MIALEKFRKLDPPSFKGSKDPLEVDNWLNELDRLFKAMNVRDEQRVTLAIFMLKGDALEWWNLQRGHKREESYLGSNLWTSFEKGTFLIA